MFSSILSRGSEQQQKENAKDQTESEQDQKPTLPQTDVDADTLFTILSNERRRLAIQVVADLGDGRINRRELSQRVAAIENGIEKRNIESQEYKRVYISLQQNHLDNLLEEGLIERRRDEIWANERTREVAQLSDAIDWATAEVGE